MSIFIIREFWPPGLQETTIVLAVVFGTLIPICCYILIEYLHYLKRKAITQGGKKMNQTLSHGIITTLQSVLYFVTSVCTSIVASMGLMTKVLVLISQQSRLILSVVPSPSGPSLLRSRRGIVPRIQLRIPLQGPSSCVSHVPLPQVVSRKSTKPPCLSPSLLPSAQPLPPLLLSRSGRASASLRRSSVQHSAFVPRNLS